MMINSEFNLTQHLDYIQRKISYITYTTTIIRRRLHTKLNLNLFRTLILPLYQLAITLYDKVSKNDQAHLKKHLYRNLKRFLCLPINTANLTIDTIFCEAHQYLLYHNRKIHNKTIQLKPLGLIIDAKEQIIAPIIPKKFPSGISKLIQLCYATKCKTHQHINNTEHITK